VHGEETPILAVKEHLEESAPVTEDVAARDLGVARDAGLVRHAAVSSCSGGPTIEISGIA